MSVLKGKFATRRDAEMAVERLVQEFQIDREAVQIAPEGPENSAGEEPGGSDAAASPALGSRANAALEGEIVVSVDVADGDASKVREAFNEFEGDPV